MTSPKVPAPGVTIIGTNRQHKTLCYQFCNFKHFLKAENSEDSLASSCEEFRITNFHDKRLGDDLGTLLIKLGSIVLIPR